MESNCKDLGCCSKACVSLQLACQAAKVAQSACLLPACCWHRGGQQATSILYFSLRRCTGHGGHLYQYP